ncbi:hypothetical protein [Actinopolyspora halophila]|uniref:hypothetical protein n=1 Tax=Actinopolyspora halophila TaxID=1850 RepID=UPI000368F996|nr:hypothetical protein [Actinopolyspora halophila]
MARVYRTVEGRHVAEGDPRAAFLAYGAGDEVPTEVRRELEQSAPVKRKPGRPPGSKNRKDRDHG